MTAPASRNQAGRALVSFRQRVEIVCEECGLSATPLQRSGKDAPRFCGPSCRHKAWRRRKREQQD